MGTGSSEFDRGELSHTSWLVPHRGVDSPWTQFTLRRYGTGFAATGVAANIAVPRLLRRKWQDWTVRGCSIYIGPDFVSFGRELGSLSQASARLFYGVDVRFGEHGRASWLWYCRTSEWLLQLHKAQLDPLPPLPEASPVSSPGLLSHQWGGRPRYLGEEPAETQASPNGVAPEDPQGGSADAADGNSDEASPCEEVVSPILVDHQLSLLFSNADGHVGLLCLPVPRNQTAAAEAAIARWAEHGEVPLTWGGRVWRTPEEFAELRETALNMPDLLLMGLETEVGMALTPDWTWEKYPRGFGEATHLEDGVGREGHAPAETPSRGAAPADAATAKEDEGAPRAEALAARAAPTPAAQGAAA